MKKLSPLPLAPYQCLLGLGMLLMAIEPTLWLVNSWLEPANDSNGQWVFLLCVGLFCWSFASEKQAAQRRHRKKAVLLLLFTTLTRAVGQVFAVNVIGAVALALDVYAIGLLTCLNERKNPLSAGWLAALFAFSLPLERILQRALGYGLQQLSAKGACLMLQGFFADVQCAGIRILLAGKDVLVDLPCSGTKTLMLLCILYTALMSVSRPRLSQGLWIGLLTLLSALLINSFRISLLATFIAYPEKIGGINVMAQPWHDLLGLLCLTIAALPLAWLGSRQISPVPPTENRALKKTQNSVTVPMSKTKLLLALAFVVLAAVIVLLPRHAADVSDSKVALNLPIYLHGEYGQAVALSKQEQDYFTQFGGAAIKMRYGENSALLIRTTSPLRHLHAPDDCLRGLGFEVQYQGLNYQPLPTAVYLATAKNGSQWRVAVTFYSEQKHFTTNVAEVVWRWFQNPHSTWYALQRITPIQTPVAEVNQWDNALFTALDLKLFVTGNPFVFKSEGVGFKYQMREGKIKP